MATLGRVLNEQMSNLVNGVHILPFYPWSSDDGFSVLDYLAVDKRYGTWDDVERLSSHRRLMVDAVINHISAGSDWFQRFRAGEQPYDRYFYFLDPDTDTSAVVRPRTHPLLTEVETVHGPRWVWTTFSPDQIDLDYRNPDVLISVLDVVLTYAARGASVIRLDAIGFMWKDPALPSIHLPETHTLIQLLRSCLDEVAPGTMLISETNVPHAENISYFHHDPPEVHAVYQFPLAPLVAHAALTGDTTKLVDWAADIDDWVGHEQSFLNFLASHDGIGVRPAEGLLDDDDIENLVAACRSVGGRVSYRATADGPRPYELNTTWFDLMSHDVDEDTAVARHLATHAVLLALPGVAGIYVHSLFGSPNDRAGFEATGHNRSLNRARFTDADWFLDAAVGDSTVRAARVYRGMKDLIARRRANPAYHPEASSQVATLTGRDLVIKRQRGRHVGVCMVNFSDTEIALEPPGGRARVLPPWHAVLE